MTEKIYDITQNIEGIFDNELEKLISFYCREDFLAALKAVDCAKPDNIKFELHNLKSLCKARGIDVKQLLSDRKLLEQIPTREEIKQNLLEIFYKMYKECPEPNGYMERIVRRQAPEYCSDTVRTAILKKFLAGSENKIGHFRTESITEWGKEKINPTELEGQETISDEDYKKLIISKIDDSIFNYSPVKLSNSKLINLIADFISKYKKYPYTCFEDLKFNAKTSAIADKLLNKHGIGRNTFSDIDKIQKISSEIKKNIRFEVDVLNSTFAENVEILFISHIQSVGLEDIYIQTKEKKIEKAKKELALLDLCRNLAESNFRTGPGMRINLYYFAFMFNMTFALDKESFNKETDIVKNLFHDYYNDNILRFLRGTYTEPRSATYMEKMPTGEGINYKNFVEAIYLYYLNKNNDRNISLLPGDMINRAEKMVEKCVKLAKEKFKKDYKTNNELTQYTVIFKSKIKEMLELREEDLPNYILENYHVFIPNNINISNIKIDSEEITAYALINNIMDELEDEYYINANLFDLHTEKNNAKKAKIKEDIAFKTGVFFDWKIKTVLANKYANDNDFLKLLDKLDERTAERNLRFTKTDKNRMLSLLYVLATKSSKNNILSLYIIKKEMNKDGNVMVNMQLSSAIKGLTDIGYDIVRAEIPNNKQNTENNSSAYGYYLGKRSYGDKHLNELLAAISYKYIKTNFEKETMLTKLLEKHFKNPNSVTRTDMIVFLFYDYINSLDYDERGIDTFPDIFIDFCNALNPVLEEARYQTISPKNVFDMYIVTALYFYILENYK